MYFELTDEQQQFADALRKWAERGYDFEHRQKVSRSEVGVCPDDWSALTELGLPALGVPTDHDGLDGTGIDHLVAMREMGRALLVEPLFATLWGCAFLRLGKGHGDLLQKVAAGKAKLACALSESNAPQDLNDVSCRAKAEHGGWVLDGTKSFVLNGAQSDVLIVSARNNGERDQASGISVFVVPADAPGVKRIDCVSIDGQRVAQVVLSDVRLPKSACLGEPGHGWPLLEHAWDIGVALLCAEGLGLLEAMLETTLDHLRTRQQFGSPIGKFQALQHRMAEVFLHTEQARSMAMLAATHAFDGSHTERGRYVSAAKARIGEALRFVGQAVVQLHGGLGVSDEMRITHMFKRATALELSLGDTDYHLARFASLPGFRAT
ncbi:MAG: acyl-CoA dehydrogenase [Ottowia sp.]|uniref:acyl-CoA dehydrogenase family protein n=1 Tax=Ottowia sp. TaxID=1898956 RepID=UPI003C726EC0